MLKNVASQKIALFAFDTTTGAPKTGDAANITAYVDKDWAGVNALTDTSASEVDSTNAKGWYLFDVAQAESNADALLFSGKSSTANVSVVGQLIFTRPPNFTKAVIDANGLMDATTVKVGPSGSATSQTAGDIMADTNDIQARLPAALVSGRMDSSTGAMAANVLTATAIANDALTAAKIADAAIDAATFAAGAIDASAIASNAIAAAKIATGAITAAKFAAGAIDAAAIADGAIDAATFASGAIDAAAIAPDAIGSSELAASAVTEIQSGLSTLDASGVRSAVGLGSANLDTQLSALAGFIDTEVASVLAAVLNLIGAGYTRTGTAQAGAAGTITLDSGASAVDDFYNNQIIVIASGTGAGQARFVSDYVGATKVASVATWATNPNNTSVFYLLPFGAIPGATAPTAVEVRQEMDNNSTQLAGIKSKTDNLPTDPADESLIIAATDAIMTRIGSAGAGLTALGDARIANLDATVSSRATPAQVNTEADTALSDVGLTGTVTGRIDAAITTRATPAQVATELGTYDAPTHAELTAELATADDAVLAAIAALNNLSQANIRTALGLASANLDTQLDALPTNAELATALAAADDAVLTALAALNNLSQANIRTAVGLGSANLDTQFAAIPSAKLTAHAAAVLVLVVGSGSTTTAVKFSTVDGGAPSTVNDFYNGAVLVITSGLLAGQRTSISDYDGATTTATVVALTGAPANGVTGVIV